ncbi:hypothetical protein MNBD_ALPHA12-1522 [hydrothermal vent metagenome]|uniref:Uncharacterized protein n=1 Tax=hydrothermal vent metagenome TaxID=652676 RepID=A0A3B0UTU4_9ZZZZ
MKLLIYGIVLGAIYIGVRRILADWSSRFRDIDKQTRERDLRERKRPDVVELKRDKDGVFRPSDKTGNSDDKKQ